MKKTIVVLCLAILSYSFSLKKEPPPIQESVPYPEGYRTWQHIKSGYMGPESEGAALFGGFHHIYANELAMHGYTSGKFPEGSVLVFDVLTAVVSGGNIEESSRFVIDVMVKDSVKFASTHGWGIERFKGDSQTERMLNDNFRAVCISCHLKKDDFVFSEYRK